MKQGEIWWNITKYDDKMNHLWKIKANHQSPANHYFHGFYGLWRFMVLFFCFALVVSSIHTSRAITHCIWTVLRVFLSTQMEAENQPPKRQKGKSWKFAFQIARTLPPNNTSSLPSKSPKIRWGLVLKMWVTRSRCQFCCRVSPTKPDPPIFTFTKAPPYSANASTKIRQARPSRLDMVMMDFAAGWWVLTWWHGLTVFAMLGEKHEHGDDDGM